MILSGAAGVYLASTVMHLEGPINYGIIWLTYALVLLAFALFVVSAGMRLRRITSRTNQQD